MAKPDLGAMTITKAKAGATVPFEQPAPAPAATGGAPVSLTIKLDPSTYAALRQYCHAKEMERGKRVTHQEVAVTAIRGLLGIEG